MTREKVKYKILKKKEYFWRQKDKVAEHLTKHWDGGAGKKREVMNIYGVKNTLFS